jgi:hypothetical protein
MKHSFACLTLLSAAALGLSGCALHADHSHALGHGDNLPPAQMLMHPGPGVDGPGPGVMAPPGYGAPVPGFVADPNATSQIAFIGPDGMHISWDVGGAGQFDSEPLTAPARYNFPQMAIYRLKLTNIPGRPGVELYPTIEVGPTMPRTAAYLAHNAIPFQLTEEDFDQVLSGNFVTKVIYLPDAEYQELALAGVETLVSTRLDPGVDPIVEADRRGSIMAIIRIGNKDLQAGGGNAQYENSDVIRTNFVQPVSLKHYHGPSAGPCGMPCGMGPGMGGMAMAGGPPPYLAGVTAPEYGMPITGTPIGLPGPPHIPLGIPAGLQRHEIINHTHTDIPGPTPNVEVHVKQEPGLSYPAPANRVDITEKTQSWGGFHQPHSDRTRVEPGPDYGCASGSCPN